MASIPSSLPPTPPFVPPIAASTPPESSSAPPRPPRRKIFTEQDLAYWLRSEAYQHVETTILRLTAAVRGKANEEQCREGEATQRLSSFLQRIRGWVAEVPLQQGPQRFGNKAFRDWLSKVEEAEPAFQGDLVSSASSSAVDPSLLLPELSFHFNSSFGSAQRLDYGSGHELSFLAYLTCLCRLRIFDEVDEQALVTRVFREYIETCREVQKVFKLEPAGSKGVWGLDDHQHLVYLFGASQLVGHPSLRPASILSVPTIEPLAPSYLFLSSIMHVHAIKRGPFHEHSPLLHQIASTVPTYQKVTKGVWEMYKAEVLAKLPVVQHCRFGEYGLRWRDRETGAELPSSGDGRKDDQDEDDGAGAVAFLDAPVVTPAPWAHPASTSSSVRPLPPSSRLSASTTASFSHRQHPTTFPLPHVSSLPSTAAHAPRSFAPPPLFPPRRPAASLAFEQEAGGTVADEGGAAATSSPFGVLPRVGLGDDAVRDVER
ncbi:Serine/threonine-protein phosphatase 2A activator 1 [Rhodotorula toruloides]